jgi:hypothetical protein
MAAARFGSSSGKGVNRGLAFPRGQAKVATKIAAKGRSAPSAAASSSSKSAK